VFNASECGFEKPEDIAGFVTRENGMAAPLELLVQVAQGARISQTRICLDGH
jgi:hypothetical protein